MPRIAAALGVLATVTLCIGFNIHRYPVVWRSVAAAPDPSAGPERCASVAMPLEAIAGAIRAAGGAAVPTPRISQPIPLPQVAGPTQPIPAPKPALAESSEEPVPDRVVAGPAAKYAHATDVAKKPVIEKTRPAGKPKAADAKKQKKDQTADAKKKSEQTAKAKPAPNREKAQAAKPKSPAQKPATALVSRPIEILKTAEPPKAVRSEPVRTEQPAGRVIERPLVPIRRDPNELVAAGVPGWNTSRSPWTAPAEPDRTVRRLPPVVGELALPQNPYAAGSNRIPFYPTTGM